MTFTVTAFTKKFPYMGFNEALQVGRMQKQLTPLSAAKVSFETWPHTDGPYTMYLDVVRDKTSAAIGLAHELRAKGLTAKELRQLRQELQSSTVSHQRTEAFLKAHYKGGRYSLTETPTPEEWQVFRSISNAVSEDTRNVIKAAPKEIAQQIRGHISYRNGLADSLGQPRPSNNNLGAIVSKLER